MKHGTVFEIPYTEGKAAYGRYCELGMFQVFDFSHDLSSNLSIDLEKLKHMKTLFSKPVNFKRPRRWKKIGVINGIEEPLFRFYMASPKVRIDGISYKDKNSLEIYEEKIIDGEVSTIIRPATLQQCIGLRPMTVSEPQHVERHIQYYYLGKDIYGMDYKFYSTLEPLAEDSWFINPPDQQP